MKRSMETTLVHSTLIIIMHFTFVLTLGTKEFQFNSTTEFNLWKEQEEERTHILYKAKGI